MKMAANKMAAIFFAGGAGQHAGQV